MKNFKNNRLIYNFFHNHNFKTVILSLISLIVNLGFVIFNTITSIIYNSIWHCTLAIYYLFLSILKGSLFLSDKRIKTSTSDKNTIIKKQFFYYRLCGILLVALASTMAGVITLMVTKGNPVRYSEIVAITIAAYTCYKITFSIINFRKARINHNLLIQSIRNIGLAESSMSLISLQIALISTFSNTDYNYTTLNAIVGFFVCIITISIGLYMIIKSSKELKKL